MLIKIADKEGKTDDVLGWEVTSEEKSLSEKKGTGSSTQGKCARIAR